MTRRKKYELFVVLKMKGATLWEGRGSTQPGHRWFDPYPSVQFLPYLWALGVILLEGQPIIIEKWVKLTINGNTEWKMTVPEGAKKRRAMLEPAYPRAVKERECCRD